MTLGPIIFGATIALVTGQTLACLWHLRWVKHLPNLTDLPASSRPSGCSVVIAARDEEGRIENTVRHLLAQKEVDLELIIVDDRSTDRTTEILQRLAREDSRLRVLRVDVLPERWLGKCHACHLGAAAASGEWLLFTDADCWLTPDVIARAIAVANQEEADHIALMPSTPAESAWTRSWHLMFLITILSWIAGVNRDRPRAHMGIGAFNLVRSSVYREFGGYEALRLTILDDVKMGLLVRRAGKRTRVFLGLDNVECHWGTTIRSMVKVMEKNYFAAIDFNVAIVIGGFLFVATLIAICVAGFLSGTILGLVAAISPFFGVVPAAILARRSGWPWRSAFGTPLMLPVFMYALLNSTFKTLRNGGVRWRDTFYSLKTLRAGMVR